MNRGNIEKFKEEAASSGGMYLKASDFEKPRKIRPILWVHQGAKIDIKTYLEGWHTPPKADKPKPIRFEIDEEIPEGKFKWAMGKSFGNQAAKPQTPKSTIAMLAWDYKSQTVKVASFGQMTIIRPFLDAMEKEIDGEENPLYVEDFSLVDIIINKNEDDGKYRVNFQPISEKNDKFYTQIEPSLKDLKFSWAAFMACEDPFDSEGEISYEDVLDVKDGERPSKPQEKQQNEEDNFDWKKIKTPKGELLTKLSDQKLSDLHDWLKEHEKTDGDLFRGVVAALADRGIEVDDIPF